MSTAPAPAVDSSAWNPAALGWPRPRPILIGAAVLAAIALPFVLPNQSWLSIATLGAIWLTLNQGWNLVLGFSGVWHFGQLAMYGIGAYTVALLALHSPLPPALNLLLGGVAAAVAALLVALPALRLRGIYVALMTFGVGEVVRLLIIADPTRTTGGSYGLTGFGGFGFEGLDRLTEGRIHYWIALGVAVLTGIAIFFLVRSPLGNGLVALRDNPPLAAARGVSPRAHQMLTFGVSGFFAGLAGGLYAYIFNVASPTLMGLLPMTLLVTMLVVGGLGTLTGPIVGTVIMTFVQARLQDWPDARLIVLGVILLAIVLAMPRGLVPVIEQQWRRLQRWMDG